MSDTTLITKPETNGKDSTFFGVSVRAWLAIMLAGAIAFTQMFVTAGVVIDAIISKDWTRVGTFANIGEPLGTLATMAVGFYLGARKST